jgi:hypothetical protein
LRDSLDALWLRPEMRAEYEFDYRHGKPNRFASSMAGGVLAVVFDVRLPASGNARVVGP